MVLVIIITTAVIILLAWIIIRGYQFFTFKSKLMNALGKIGIPYEQANDIYTHRTPVSHNNSLIILK